MTALDPAKVRVTAPIALKALTDHMVANGLDAPHTITCDHHGLRVSVHAESADRWITSIHVDDRSTLPSTVVDGYSSTYVDGRLPLLGIKVRIRYIARTAGTRPLRAVTA